MHPSVSFPGHESDDGAGKLYCRKARRQSWDGTFHNLATSMIGQIGIELDVWSIGHEWDLHSRYDYKIKDQLRRMSAETLGRIAAQGNSDYRFVSDVSSKPSLMSASSAPFDVRASGRELLTEIACRAIVAEMLGIFEHRREVKERARRRKSERQLTAVRRSLNL